MPSFVRINGVAITRCHEWLYYLILFLFIPTNSQSTSRLLEDDHDWSLGESIIKTLSRGNLFDIENPTHERYVSAHAPTYFPSTQKATHNNAHLSLYSEREIVKAWPDLTSKLKKWRQSQQKYVFNDMSDVLGCWYNIIINVLFLVVFVSSLHQVVEESGDVFTEYWFSSTHTHHNHHPQPIIINL